MSNDEKLQQAIKGATKELVIKHVTKDLTNKAHKMGFLNITGIHRYINELIHSNTIDDFIGGGKKIRKSNKSKGGSRKKTKSKKSKKTRRYKRMRNTKKNERVSMRN
jgi:hypothetical protein